MILIIPIILIILIIPLDNSALHTERSKTDEMQGLRSPSNRSIPKYVRMVRASVTPHFAVLERSSKADRPY